MRCWCGEIGKRGDLTSHWAKALVGSSPTTSILAHPLTRLSVQPMFCILVRSPRRQFRYAKKAGEQKLSGFRVWIHRLKPALGKHCP